MTAQTPQTPQTPRTPQKPQASQRPPKKKRWLLRTPAADAPARLFCFPYSGTGASMYNKWPDRVGPAEVCRIQLPGRENRVREEHFGTYEALAADLAPALLPHLDRPFGFFGHCGGALAAFATAHRLAELGMPVPDVLFMSSQVAPHQGPYGRYLTMDETGLRGELERLTRVMGAEPVPDLIDLGLGVMNADLAANRAYRTPEPVVLPTRVRPLGWHDDQEVAPERMTGWEECAPAGWCARTVLPGDHHAFLRAPEPLVDVLAADLADAVAARAAQ
ncbi:thioesterase II family protein [Streptomyces sp. AN091965]|uniref:thioesterase II family protein n=1 Tax=Streptomyces sp. AN091965 TaxID=2927803 RepID=UPI001F604E9C|nr:thioesterase domain-containing protein [Streptomyces sp. AN091965]MCI3928706.1 thioesterase domain-containing protein [Streptomyces sp. AN091965]